MSETPNSPDRGGPFPLDHAMQELLDSGILGGEGDGPNIEATQQGIEVSGDAAVNALRKYLEIMREQGGSDEDIDRAQARLDAALRNEQRPPEET